MIFQDPSLLDLVTLSVAAASLGALVGVAVACAFIARGIKRLNERMVDLVLHMPSHGINRLADELQDTPPKLIQSMALLAKGMERIALKIEDSNRLNRPPASRK